MNQIGMAICTAAAAAYVGGLLVGAVAVTVRHIQLLKIKRWCKNIEKACIIEADGEVKESK